MKAARPGEPGRDFAVVATEVRSLASRSASAAEDIKARGARSDPTLDAMTIRVHQVSDLGAEIAAAGIEQGSLTISQTGGITQQHAALVAQSAAAGCSLEAPARHRCDTTVGAIFSRLAAAGVAATGAAPGTSDAFLAVAIGELIRPPPLSCRPRGLHACMRWPAQGASTNPKPLRPRTRLWSQAHCRRAYAHLWSTCSTTKIDDPIADQHATPGRSMSICAVTIRSSRIANH